MTPEEIRAKIAELAAQLPADETPAEPPDIRKTNASDDPCPMCQQVHPKDPNEPITCRCLYCGNIDRIAMSTYDSQLGMGVVCPRCCGAASPRNFQQLEAEALNRGADTKLPWQ